MAEAGVSTPVSTASVRPTRPRRRGQCAGQPTKRCPWITCAHHLAVDVTEDGSLRINVPGARQLPLLKPTDPKPPTDVWADHVAHAIMTLPYTCALDVADEGPVSLPRIGRLMGVSKERARQLDETGKESLALALREAGLTKEDLL